MYGEKMIIVFGPVAQAAHGGHSSPTLDLLVGFGVLALTWTGYFRRDAAKPVSIWVAVDLPPISQPFITGVSVGLTRPHRISSL